MQDKVKKQSKWSTLSSLTLIFYIVKEEYNGRKGVDELHNKMKKGLIETLEEVEYKLKITKVIHLTYQQEIARVKSKME